MTTLNLDGLAPEARPVVARAAEVYLAHVGAHLIGLLAHGSAVKGGFIPGSSDVDLQLFLEDAAFSEGGRLPLAACAAIHLGLSEIDLGPFTYIQCYAFGPRLRPPFLGPIPGAYHMVAGRLPVPEADAAQLMGSARAALARLDPAAAFESDELLTSGGGHLERRVRWVATVVWPAMAQAAALHTGDALLAWRTPKPQLGPLLPEACGVRAAAAEFERRLRAYGAGGRSAEAGVAVVGAGVGALRAARTWWESQAGQI